MKIIRMVASGAVGFLAAAMLAGCATTNISVDQAVDAETLEHQTYAWASESVIASPPEGVNRARLNALRNAITEALDSKGYERVDDETRAGLLVNVDVAYGYNEGRGESLLMQDDDDEEDAGSIRVYEGRQQPTSTATRTQRSRAATMARSAGEDAGFSGDVRSLIVIAISERDSAIQLWRGSIDKTINLADMDSFAFEIGDDVAQLFADFPSSRR